MVGERPFSIPAVSGRPPSLPTAAHIASITGVATEAVQGNASVVQVGLLTPVLAGIVTVTVAVTVAVAVAVAVAVIVSGKRRMAAIAKPIMRTLGGGSSDVRPAARKTRSSARVISRVMPSRALKTLTKGPVRRLWWDQSRIRSPVRTSASTSTSTSTSASTSASAVTNRRRRWSTTPTRDMRRLRLTRQLWRH